MARRGSITPLLELLILLIVVWYAHKSGLLKKLLDSIGAGGGGGSGTVIWTSKGKWDDGKSRILKNGQIDSSGFKAKEDTITVDGKGNCIIRSGNRIYIPVDNHNVDVSMDVIATKGVEDVSINARSNHHFYSGKCGFAGYHLATGTVDAGETHFKKEPFHGLYSARIAQVPASFPLDTKTNVRLVVKDAEGGGVKNEAYINGKMVTSYVDKGDVKDVVPLTAEEKTILKDECGGKAEVGSTDADLAKPYMGIGKSVWIRVNGTAEEGEGTGQVTVSNVVIKDLGGSGSATTSTPTPTEPKSAYTHTQTSSTLNYLLFD